MRCIMLSFPNFFNHVPDPLPMYALIDQQGKITTALQELCQLTDICITNEEDLIKLTEDTQEKWFQGKKGKERWLFEKFEAKSKEEQAKIITCLTTLGTVSQVTASNSQYDFVLINGAMASCMQARINFLAKEYDRGIRFEKVILLGSQRELNSKFKLEAQLIEKGCTTEAQALKFLWGDTNNLPDTVKLTAVSIHAKNKSDAQRASTEETIQAFISTQPSFKEKSRLLSVSSNPHIIYQDIEVRAAVKKIHPVIVETIGPRPTTLNIEKHLDSLARCLHSMQYKLGHKNIFALEPAGTSAFAINNLHNTA